MVTFTDSDDRRSAHLRNKAIQNANAVRERRATLENPDWLMSRPANWYTELGESTSRYPQGEPTNWLAAKNVLKHIPAVTTDMDENRNIFQMLANQAKGGDRGARLIDTRGLPAGARRTGRTMFQDPSKAQGFLGDVGSLFTGNNRAAVYADEYNPFPKAGFGKDWYKDQFPIASGLGSLMGLAEKSPTLNMLAGLFPKKERVPLDRDLSWVPEGMGEYDEIPEIPFMGEEVDELDIEDFPFLDIGVDEQSELDLVEPGFDLDKAIEDERAGKIKFKPWIGSVESGGEQGPYDITENLEETTETFTDLGDTHDFTESWKTAFDATEYIDVQEYVKTMSNTEGSLWYGKDEDWIVKDMIKRNYIKEK